MIYGISSSLPSFKDLEFHSGLNILLADKAPGSSQKQTRNRAGKTSLIEVIHFLTGGDCDADSIFRSDALIEQSFGIEVDVAGSRVKLDRSGSVPAKLLLPDGDYKSSPIRVRQDKKTQRLWIRNSEWKSILGQAWFGLEDGEEEDDTKHRPTFRSVFPYFARRQQAGGFSSPFKHSTEQQTGNQQVALLYLLDLDWSIAQDWQRLRDQERTLRELKKAAGEGALGRVIGSSAQLRTKVTVADDRVKQLEGVISSFRVLPEYHELEAEASKLTQALSKLSEDDTVDRHLLDELRDSTTSEVPPPATDLDRMYGELGLVFTAGAVRRFEEVRTFHESVIANRKNYLEQEIKTAEDRIAKRSAEMEQIDKRRAEVMSILRSHGALEQYGKLQSELTRLQTEAEALRQQFAIAQTMEGQRAELITERGKLQSNLQHDFKERNATLKNAILTFERISSQLYEKAGSLTINEGANGPEFGIDIQGSRSKGIANMQIFCFDMMLVQLCKARGLGPGFLIHDSHIFDGVDDRQISKALQVGAKLADEFKFQYIVTMNSDVLEAVRRDSPKDFSVDKFVLPTRLSDEKETGGLFGIRFD